MSRLYPSDSPSRSFPAPTVTVPSSNAPEWTLLTATTEGNSPIDSTTMAATVHTHNTSTGLFEVDTTAHTTAVDGFRENMLAWSLPLLTLYPDFDPETDELHLALDFQGAGQFPTPGANTGCAVYAGLADSITVDASRQAVIATSIGVSGGFSVGFVSTTNMTASASSQNPCELVYQRINFHLHPSTSQWAPLRVISSLGDTAGFPLTPTVYGFAQSPTFRNPISNWVLVTGVGHINTTDFAAIQLKWRVWHRRVRVALANPVA